MSNTIENLFDGAPDDATHARDYKHGVDFYKRENGRWLYADKGSWKVAFGTSEKDCVERPQPKPWSGPEDGLPPVGSRVIVHECTHYHAKRFNGQLVRIVAHDEGKYAVFAADNFEYHALVAEKFKLPPTAADIAADKRETAIRELMDIAQVDCRVTAARLVDAGFKREAV